FERDDGAWAINDQFAGNLDVAIATPQVNRTEVWHLVNKSGGWAHPIHIHLDFMRVLTRNGKPPPLDERDGFAKRDTVDLGPNDEIEIAITFHDFLGKFVFHCHNLEHEDFAMMVRFDVVESPGDTTPPPSGSGGTSKGGRG